MVSANIINHVLQDDLDVRRVLLALPGDHGHPRHQADAGGPLGPNHEGHGERMLQRFVNIDNNLISVHEAILDNQPDVDTGRVTKT